MPVPKNGVSPLLSGLQILAEFGITSQKVLFICHGNISRSPMAEFIFKGMVEKEGCAGEFCIEPAATSYEEIPHGMGNPVYPPAKEKLAQHGISCEGKRARKLLREDIDEFDYLIAMEDFNIKNIRKEFGAEPARKVTTLLSYTERGGNIADPWYTGNFDITYDAILEGCAAFLEQCRKKAKTISFSPISC